MLPLIARRSVSVTSHFLRSACHSRIAFLTQSRPQLLINRFVSAMPVATRYHDIVKSPLDKRQYRGIELENGLRVLLISDPTTDLAAVSMDVAAGHLMDKWAMPGTAHFCEHMLFLGTDKYPEENAYSKFLEANAGNSNAYTASDHTNYYFKVKPDALEGAIDRFVQFFLSPQFTESATEREVKAVDSEHANNKNTDPWRFIQVERYLSKQGHDYGKFGTGDKNTLDKEAREKGLDPRKELLEFHRRWYSSNVMSCVIVGKESLDELEKLVESKQFGQIENRQVEKRVWEEHPYGPEQLGHRVMIVPIKDTRNLKIVFPIPYIKDSYKTQPAHYLSHLIGHEGKGSILSELKRRGWASSIVAGGQKLARGIEQFDIMCDLSYEGVRNTENIVKLVFQYIGLLRREGIQQWIQDEQQKIGKTTFIYQDKISPMKAANTFSADLQDIPFEDILSAEFSLQGFDPETIRPILDALVPENMLYRVVSKRFAGMEGNITEPVYGTEMRIEKFSEKESETFRLALDEPHPSLMLPERNTYIPEKFELKKVDEEEAKGLKSTDPRVIHEDAYSRVWFKQDEKYGLPKMFAQVKITAPMVSKDPRTQLIANMFITAFNDAMTEETYNPLLAGLNYDAKCAVDGIKITADGFDEKLPVFVHDLVKRMVAFTPNADRVKVLFDLLKQSLDNSKHDKPYHMSMIFERMLLSERYWSKAQLRAVATDMTVDELLAFRDRLLSSFHVELFAHGNVTKSEVLAMAAAVTETLKTAIPNTRPLFHNEAALLREHEVECGNSLIYRHFQDTHAVSSAQLFLQIGVQNTREDAMVELIVQLLREPAFNQLRTQEQLGYIVFTSSAPNNGTNAFELLVQGPNEGDFVLGRMEKFLFDIRSELDKMTEEEFMAQVESLAARLLVQPKTLKGKSKILAKEIDVRQYDFDRDNNEVETLRQLKKEEVLDFYDKKIIPGGSERRKVVILVHGKHETRENVERKKRDAGDLSENIEIECIEDVRQSMALFPRPRPKLSLRPFGVSATESAEEKKEESKL